MYRSNRFTLRLYNPFVYVTSGKWPISDDLDPCQQAIVIGWIKLRVIQFICDQMSLLETEPHLLYAHDICLFSMQRINYQRQTVFPAILVMS
jgi:hypothetical protein